MLSLSPTNTSPLNFSDSESGVFPNRLYRIRTPKSEGARTVTRINCMKLVKHIILGLSWALLAGSYQLHAQSFTPAQQAYFKASNAGARDEFGWSVAVSGNTAVVAAQYESSNATGVNGNQTNNSAFQSGAAYVFVRDGSNWIQQAYLKASNTGGGDWFGYSVSISGDTIVVGAPLEDSNTTGINGNQSNNSAPDSGAAYVFVRNGTNWVQQAYLKASNTGGPLSGDSAGDTFGWSVAVSGDTVIVSAIGEDSNAAGVNGNQGNNSAPNSGAAYVFVREGTNWVQQAYLKASNTGGPSPGESFGDGFGKSVGVSGDTVVVSADGEDSNATGLNGNQGNNSALDSGAAYVFVRNGTNWIQQAYLKASNTGAGDEFGASASVSGDTVVVGAMAEDSNATGANGNQGNNSTPSSGAAYVFVRDGTNWTQQAYVKASNTGMDDNFGISVALSGDMLVVGAAAEDSNTTGINGDQSNNSAFDAGAAYVFRRNGTTWSQQAYLKASNTGGPLPGEDYGDNFGADHAVGVSGDTVLVGGFAEDSNGTGVNGNQTIRTAMDSGAAYVFTGFGAATRLALASDGSGGYFINFKGTPDLTYRLQRALSLTGPWDTITTNTAPASGLIEYHETTLLPDAAFYRTVQP
jgi:hypothetical protein